MKLLRLFLAALFVTALLCGQASHAQSPKWQVEEGVLYFSVTSDGTTGEQWITRLEKKGIHVGAHAAFMLRSPDFKPTRGVTTRVAVLKGYLWENADRFSQNICAGSILRKLEKPNPEVACLIREKFTDDEIEAMGLSFIVVMHEPIKNANGDPRLLGAGRDGKSSWVVAFWGQSYVKWNIDGGFAFVVPQK